MAQARELRCPPLDVGAGFLAPDVPRLSDKQYRRFQLWFVYTGADLAKALTCTLTYHWCHPLPLLANGQFRFTCRKKPGPLP
jgi:hypothetical protein